MNKKKYLLMMILIVFLFISIIKPKITLAAPTGFLNGLTLTYGTTPDADVNTTTLVTDNNMATGLTTPVGTSNSKPFYIIYTFATDVSINAVYNWLGVQSSSVQSFVAMYKVIGGGASTYTAIEMKDVGGGWASFGTVTSVRKVVFKFIDERTIYELDIRGPVTSPTPTPTPTPTPDTTPPANVSGLTNFTTLTSASLSFTTPIDSDFSRYKIYQNGSLIYTSATGITKGSPMAYTASSLSSSTSYLYKITTVDVTGNESLGVTTTATTLTPDTTPPANVSNLAASNIAYTSVNLNFTTPSDSDFSKYKIYKDGILIYTSIAGIQKNYPLSYPVIGLTVTTSYVFKVTTLDVTGNESLGQTINVTTLTPDLTPPAIPSNLVITGANGSANFTWNAVSDIDLKGYYLYKDGVRLFSTAISATNFNLSGLVTGQSYNYTISAIDLSGNESAQSMVYPYISADTMPPAVPFGLHAIVSNESASIGWNPVSNTDLAGYYVYQDGVKISVLVTNNAYTINGLTNYKTYNFKVSSADITGNESSLSSAVTAMPIPAPDTTPPDVPFGIVLSAGDEQIQVAWQHVTNVDLLGYNIYRDGVKLNPIPLNYNKYIDNSVTNDVYYSYQVSSIDHNNNQSNLSVSVSATPIASNVPKVHVNFSLLDLVNGIENWFSDVWLILAFSIAIPLSFYVAHRVKALY